MSIYDNATPGHCVVCGTKAIMDLCPKCNEEYTDTVTGELHPAVRELRDLQHLQAVNDRNNATRVMRGTMPHKRGRGPKYVGGVRFISLETLAP